MVYLEGLLLNDERELENTEMMECPVCEGNGFIEMYVNEWDLVDEDCMECDGTGKVRVI